MTTTKAGLIVDHREGLHEAKLELRCPICRDMSCGIYWCDKCGRRNKPSPRVSVWKCKSCKTEHEKG